MDVPVSFPLNIKGLIFSLPEITSLIKWAFGQGLLAREIDCVFIQKKRCSVPGSGQQPHRIICCSRPS